MGRLLAASLLLAALVAGYASGRPYWEPLWQGARGLRTLNGVLDRYAPAARARLAPHFVAAGIGYPPTALTLLALKQERELELWAADIRGEHRLIRRYPIRRLSGRSGPKLREGDRQVPEGVYRIVRLNPNSAYHLSMELDYPNEFDRLHAREDGRDRPGSEIFIHGKAVSIGCLAMGDETVEELFVLAADVGIEPITLVIAPRDPRLGPLEAGPGMPPWVPALYRRIEERFRAFPRPVE